MNVKPGDLAIVIASTAGNEGAIVEVIRALGEWPSYGGYRWDSTAGHYWLCKSTGRTLRATPGGEWEEMPIRDKWLRPISGLPDAEYTDSKQPIKETA